ncbi:KU80 protein [Trypanosoma brucei equiperdum]|uniref:KU80 protein n=1 Tax=Trypanosoma brucei equiperdum TaxID=630700 RepID=A0A3L6L827_9TRYP|nr:KU80 protein [Trypanosoma brucei equiperdum]
MAFRTSTIFALDVNCSISSLAQAVEFCRLSVLKTMCPSSYDEVALVVAGGCRSYSGGTSTSISTCGSAAQLSAPCLPAPPSVELITILHRILRDREEQQGVGSSANFIETLTLCVEVFNLKKRRKQFREVLYLLTDAHAEVVRKSVFRDVLNALRARGVTLIVVGIDFSQVTGEGSLLPGESAPSLTSNRVKVDNETVLYTLCKALGNDSRVITLRDALVSAAQLVCRKVRSLAQKTVFTIGEVRLATNVLGKVRRMHVPANRTPAPTERVPGSRKAAHSQLFDEETLRLEGGEEDSQKTCLETPVNKPTASSSNRLSEATKIRGSRGIDAVACIPQNQVPVHVLVVDTSYMIAPLDDDPVGTRAFRSIVKALAAQDSALVVRYVRSTDGNPNMFLCVPLTTGDEDVLFMSRLPFMEEIRCLRFPTLQEMEMECDIPEADAQREQELVSSIVEEMTVGEEVLHPHRVLNPFVQQYYATQRAMVNRWCSRTAENPLSAHEDSDIKLALLPQLRGISAGFASPGCKVEQLVSRTREKLETCCRVFAYVPRTTSHSPERKVLWERIPAGQPPVSETVENTEVASPAAPSTLQCHLGSGSSVTCRPVCANPPHDVVSFIQDKRTMFHPVAHPLGSSSS